MKNTLKVKQNRLLIQFRKSNRINERILSFRTTSVKKAQDINE